jgi:hypothetical protein
MLNFELSEQLLERLFPLFVDTLWLPYEEVPNSFRYNHPPETDVLMRCGYPASCYRDHWYMLRAITTLKEQYFENDANLIERLPAVLEYFRDIEAQWFVADGPEEFLLRCLRGPLLYTILSKRLADGKTLFQSLPSIHTALQSSDPIRLRFAACEFPSVNHSESIAIPSYIQKIMEGNAVLGDTFSIVREFLQGSHGEDRLQIVNSPDESLDGGVLLHYAIRVGDVALTTLLLATPGVFLHPKDNGGHVPFHFATSSLLFGLLHSSLPRPVLAELFKSDVGACARIMQEVWIIESGAERDDAILSLVANVDLFPSFFMW